MWNGGLQFFFLKSKPDAPWKINSSPLKIRSSQNISKGISSFNHWFSGAMLVSGSVYETTKWKAKFLSVNGFSAGFLFTINSAKPPIRKWVQLGIFAKNWETTATFNPGSYPSTMESYSFEQDSPQHVSWLLREPLRNIRANNKASISDNGGSSPFINFITILYFLDLLKVVG